MYVSSISVVNLYLRPGVLPAGRSFAAEMGCQDGTREEPRSSAQTPHVDVSNQEEDSERWDGLA